MQNWSTPPELLGTDGVLANAGGDIKNEGEDKLSAEYECPSRDNMELKNF